MEAAVIRFMSPADINLVLNVEEKCFAVPWSRAAFKAEIGDNDLAHYFVVELNGQVVGYAGMWIILDEAHITNVAVLPAFQRKGFGEKLMDALIELAKAKGATSMTLEVRVSNVDAQRLYRRLGFVARGLRRQYYTDTQEDALIMWRDSL
jgi:ribosomal-protein-alanine N-acetyltransferase